MTILGSQSKLRIELLAQAGYAFDTVDPGVDERAIEMQLIAPSPLKVVRVLSESKAWAVDKRFRDDIVIAADTVVTTPTGAILHKPAGLDDAIRMAMLQSGRTISIFTAMTVCRGPSIAKCATVSRVSYVDFDESTVRNLFQDFRCRFMQRRAVFSYRCAWGTLERRCSGSHTGAIGLPMHYVRDAISSFEADGRDGLSTRCRSLAFADLG